MPSCSNRSDPILGNAAVLRRARPLLGTFVEITAAGLPEDGLRAATDAAFLAVETVGRRMSFHDPASTLSRINRDAAQRPVPVDEWTHAVLRLAAELHAASAGVFDVTVAPALQALGFLPGRVVPTQLRVHPSFADVELRPDRTVRFHRPGVALDLGGIAKGFAVDQAVYALRRGGVPRGLVNAGGDLRAFGGAPGFPVEIRAPLAPGERLARVVLRDGALATSAATFTHQVWQGRAHGPFIDPRAGRPGAGLLSASVTAADAVLADALTKWVLLAPDAALAYLEAAGAAALIVRADGAAQCTSNWDDTLGPAA